MKDKRSFLHCTVCGNLAGMIHDSGVVPVCCGKEMVRLAPNTEDAAQEKHVPVAVRDGDTITVTVGAVDHPMLEEHYIAWIALAQGNHTQRMVLKPGQKPAAVFAVGKEPATAYAYCNLHGLWAADV